MKVERAETIQYVERIETRSELQRLGVALEDRADGTIWRATRLA